MIRYFKSILEQDEAPVVVCDLDSTVLYMNPAAKARYHVDLTGKSVKACHPPYANARIERVLDWFLRSPENNKVYTFRNDTENKDVYVIALRDEDKTLIGYYEKHVYRTPETEPLYAPFQGAPQ